MDPEISFLNIYPMESIRDLSKYIQGYLADYKSKKMLTENIRGKFLNKMWYVSYKNNI